MNKRTLVLSASLGILLLSAGPATAPKSFRGLPISSLLAPVEEHVSVSDSRRTEEASAQLLKAAYGPTDTHSEEEFASPVEVNGPTLWLARAIYSETKLPHEQELVAWVIRNRVESNYRGKSTYRGVVLDPYQFSAFNPNSPKRQFLLDLGPETELAVWQQALWVAYYVRHAAPVYRPFSVETRHFYSERSMKEHQTPYWAEGSQFVAPDSRRGYPIDEWRFRFYKKIS